MPRGAARISCGNCRETTDPKTALEEWTNHDLELVRCPDCRCPECGRGYRYASELPAGHDDAPGWGIVHDYERHEEDGRGVREYTDYCTVDEPPENARRMEVPA